MIATLTAQVLVTTAFSRSAFVLLPLRAMICPGWTRASTTTRGRRLVIGGRDTGNAPAAMPLDGLDRPQPGEDRESWHA